MNNLSSDTNLSYVPSPAKGRQIDEQADKIAFISSYVLFWLGDSRCGMMLKCASQLETKSRRGERSWHRVQISLRCVRQCYATVLS